MCLWNVHQRQFYTRVFPLYEYIKLRLGNLRGSLTECDEYGTWDRLQPLHGKVSTNKSQVGSQKVMSIALVGAVVSNIPQVLLWRPFHTSSQMLFWDNHTSPLACANYATTTTWTIR